MVTWVQGRAFVYAGSDKVEYVYRLEKSATFPRKNVVRSFGGRLRELDKCRPLDYVCDPKNLNVTF
jgi:hypothetical protein